MRVGKKRSYKGERQDSDWVGLILIWDILIRWGVCELKAELVGLGLSPSGTKAELVDRLVEAVDNMPNEGNTI